MSVESLVEPAEERARRAHLPDVGADVRVQPAVRALPVVERAARPARADHRRGQARARRAARSAGVLHQHRRRRADGAPRLLRARRVLDQPRDIGVKFSTNGAFIDAEKARRFAAMDYLDIQISLDGIDAPTNDAVRGVGSYDMARRAMDNLARGGLRPVQDQRRRHPPQRRPARRVQGSSPTRTARSCASPGCGPAAAAPTRGTTCTRPTPSSGRSTTGCWPRARRCSPATRSSTSTPWARPLPGLNMCGAGRVVCLIDPIGDVYACPFVIHDQFKAGSVRDDGGFATVWKHSELFLELREPQSAGACASCGSYDACQGGCMAAKFFTGLPLDGPDPECVSGHGDWPLLAADRVDSTPRPGMDHSKPRQQPSR